MTFHPDILGPAQKRALRQLAPMMTSSGFYLAGGTALAIYLGHRRSVDLDWFTSDRIPDPEGFAKNIQDQGMPLEPGYIDRGTLYGTLEAVQVSFMESTYPLLAPPITWPEFGCQLASLEDIAAMKLHALIQRGAKKDFVDIYALGLRYAPLAEIISCYRKKYGVSDSVSIIYSLSYLRDAERERIPPMLWPEDWQTIKKTIKSWLKNLP